MSNVERLKKNIAELVSKHIDLKEKNLQLQEKLDRIQKDIEYLKGKNQEYPELVLKNKKLMTDRVKVAAKIAGILKSLDEVKV